MAEFLDPFKIKELGRKLTDRELSRALRMAQSAELEATHFYEALADACDNKDITKILQDVANEEKVHTGEFEKALRMIDKEEEKYFNDGMEESNKIVSRILSRLK
jgi:rubrerythrin